MDPVILYYLLLKKEIAYKSTHELKPMLFNG